MIGIVARCVIIILTMQYGAAELDLNHGVVLLASLVTCAVVEAIVAAVTAWSTRGGRR